jgi:transcriptional regulator with XRE-family HTH domain
MDTQTPNPIAAYRQAKDLTLEGFGLLVGVKKAAVSKWENGRSPSPLKAVEIEQATGIPRHELRPDLWEGDATDAPAPSTDVVAAQ